MPNETENTTTPDTNIETPVIRSLDDAPAEPQVQPAPDNNPKPVDQHVEKMMCDFGHKFSSNSVRLIPFRNPTEVSLGELIFTDSNNYVWQSLDSAPKDGFLLACPVCGVIHCEGFSVIDASEEALTTQDNMPVERVISLNL